MRKNTPESPLKKTLDNPFDERCENGDHLMVRRIFDEKRYYGDSRFVSIMNILRRAYSFPYRMDCENVIERFRIIPLCCNPSRDYIVFLTPEDYLKINVLLQLFFASTGNLGCFYECKRTFEIRLGFVYDVLKFGDFTVEFYERFRRDRMERFGDRKYRSGCCVFRLWHLYRRYGFGRLCGEFGYRGDYQSLYRLFVSYGLRVS